MLSIKLYLHGLQISATALSRWFHLQGELLSAQLSLRSVLGTVTFTRPGDVVFLCSTGSDSRELGRWSGEKSTE